MFRPRVIPLLLLKNNGLVKTIKFKDSKYIGDPINAVRIFNAKETDELIFLDITATKEKRKISLELLAKIADEAFMPFSAGGGISSLDDIKKLINTGVEKVVINSYAIEHPEFIKLASDTFGSSTIIISIDVKKKMLDGYEVYSSSAAKSTGIDPIMYAEQCANYGAGEILINSIERDGIMQGYDIELIKKISNAVSIPVIACGGAGKLSDFSEAYYKGNASSVAAGSLFVFHGPRRAVLINYPSKEELNNIF
ncbi:MAG: AglZ/HisF2 family acetamidino modification protein [Ignavibacterium sp.]|nr:AglZ/HisF2 family acetamidino modification protein [Ignavibacterium sp.]